MTDQSGASLGFCESCGARRIIAGQGHCVACGRKLLQPSEIALGPVAAVAVPPAAAGAPLTPAGPAESAEPPPVASPNREQSMAAEVPTAAFTPVLPTPASTTAPIAPPPWAATAPGDAAATPPAEIAPASPAPEAPGTYPNGFAQPPTSAQLGEAPIDAATGQASPMQHCVDRFPAFNTVIHLCIRDAHWPHPRAHQARSLADVVTVRKVSGEGVVEGGRVRAYSA
jgi:hypothetical protein